MEQVKVTGRSVLRYLRRAARLYPRGIPRSAIVAAGLSLEPAAKAWGQAALGKAALLFLGDAAEFSGEANEENPFPGVHGKLLADAVTKGLMLPLASAGLITFNAAAPDSVGLTQKLLLKTAPRVVVVLGAGIQAGDIVTSATPVVKTERPSDVLQEKTSKRIFWDDLQRAKALLGEVK